jgi:hypothetical protein
MEVDPRLAAEAIQEGLQKYPDMSSFGARLLWRPLFKGGAFMLEYENQPPRDHPNAWEFQNAVVRAYKRRAGVQ